MGGGAKYDLNEKYEGFAAGQTPDEIEKNKL